MPVPAHSPPHTARVVELIFVPAMRGDGSEGDPERMINLYFSKEGELIACYDPLYGPPDGYVARAQCLSVEPPPEGDPIGPIST